MTKVFALACLFAASAAVAHGATLGAAAGLGGVAKAGRWTPLRVSIASSGERLDGELHVTWGDASLRRPVTLSAGDRRDFELYLRTSDARATIDVKLVSGGRDVAAVAAAVRVLGFDDAVVVCARADTTAAAGGDCTTTVLARDLPRSARGYEVADRVEWPGGRPALDADQDAALRAWLSLEALDASGDLGLTPQVSRPQLSRGLPANVSPAVAAIGAAYVALFIAAAVTLRARRARLSYVAITVALVTAGACAAVAGIGRIGPTRAVHLHHVSLLQQLPGTGQAVLTMRAIAEFPAFDTFAVRLPSPDAALETTTPRGGVTGRLDAEGFPVVGGVFGVGGRQSFAGEAVLPVRLLAVEERVGGVEIENLSDRPLRDCRVGAGLAAMPISGLAPGERLSASWAPAGEGAAGGPLLTCVADDAALPLTESRRPVVMHGVTTVAVYRDAARGAGGD